MSNTPVISQFSCGWNIYNCPDSAWTLHGWVNQCMSFVERVEVTVHTYWLLLFTRRIRSVKKPASEHCNLLTGIKNGLCPTGNCVLWCMINSLQGIERLVSQWVRNRSMIWFPALLDSAQSASIPMSTSHGEDTQSHIGVTVLDKWSFVSDFNETADLRNCGFWCGFFHWNVHRNLWFSSKSANFMRRNTSHLPLSLSEVFQTKDQWWNDDMWSMFTYVLLLSIGEFSFRVRWICL